MFVFIWFSSVSLRLSPGSVDFDTRHFGPTLEKSTMTSEEYKNIVLQAKEHILAGDIFQIVLSQRFERRTFADPFEIYRALRVVNPSPYMTYLQVWFSVETYHIILILYFLFINSNNFLIIFIRLEGVLSLLPAQKFSRV